jgi:hypothetical protein
VDHIHHLAVHRARPQLLYLRQVQLSPPTRTFSSSFTQLRISPRDTKYPSSIIPKDSL